MMKKSLILCLLWGLFSAPVAVFSQSAPLWYTDLAKAFPPQEFLAFLGTGATADLARQDALAQVALYLGAEIQATTDGYKLAREVQGPGSGESRFEYEVRQKVSTQSRHPVVGLVFTPAFASDDGQVAVAASWNRTQALRLLADQIGDQGALVDRALSRTKGTSALEAWVSARRALTLGDDVMELDRIRRLLVPGTASLVPETFRNRLDQVRSADLRPRVVLRVEGEESTRVSEGLRQSLTQFGFVLQPSGPLVLQARAGYEAPPGSGTLFQGVSRLELILAEGEAQLWSLTIDAKAVGTTAVSARNRTFNDLLSKIKADLIPSLQLSFEKYAE